EVNVGSAFWPYGAQEPAHIDAEPVFSDERWSIEHTNIPDQILQALKRALNQAFRAADYPQTSP
ncbi:MAG TPA: hypothetical protein VLF67_04000, partial [Candidatus Saccharimonas sp.]|nr:hypothetical protein [Candidatus Saccharimonas sp.]